MGLLKILRYLLKSKKKRFYSLRELAMNKSKRLTTCKTGSLSLNKTSK